MSLSGVVTNVANFGAFVDIGAHQDGLVHISRLSDSFVKDPRDAVKTGAVVKVRVLEVDIARKRISLSMKSSVDVGPQGQKTAHKNTVKNVGGPHQLASSTMADAFLRPWGNKN